MPASNQAVFQKMRESKIFFSGYSWILFNLPEVSSADNPFIQSVYYKGILKLMDKQIYCS